MIGNKILFKRDIFYESTCVGVVVDAYTAGKERMYKVDQSYTNLEGVWCDYYVDINDFQLVKVLEYANPTVKHEPNNYSKNKIL